MFSKSVALIDHVGIKAGLDHYDSELLSALVKLNCRVKCFSNFNSGKYSFPLEKIFSFTEHYNFFNLFGLLFNYWKAFRNCRREKFHSIILHIFHFNRVEFLILKLARLYGLRVIAIVHDAESFVGNTKPERIQKICTTLIDKIVVHNIFTKEELLRNFSSEQKPEIYVIPHGHFLNLPNAAITREDARKKFGFSADHKVILFFGMIKPGKGLELLIESLSSLPPDFHLVIAGRMRKNSFTQYNEIIQSKNLDGRVSAFVRYVPNEERELLFKAADLVVIPYRKVYQSAVLLMAMSFGIPVLASDLVPNRLIIDNGVNGFLFRDGSEEDLSNKIKEIFRTNYVKQTISSNAKQYLDKRHDWDLIAQSFYSLIS